MMHKNDGNKDSNDISPLMTMQEMENDFTNKRCSTGFISVFCLINAEKCSPEFDI